MYKTYHYDNMPRPVPDSGAAQPAAEKSAPRPEPAKKTKDGLLSGFSNLQNDDLILLAVIAVLLTDDCDDKLLLAALGIIFFIGKND